MAQRARGGPPPLRQYTPTGGAYGRAHVPTPRYLPGSADRGPEPQDTSHGTLGTDGALTASFPSRGWASDSASEAASVEAPRYDWRARAEPQQARPSTAAVEPPQRKVYDWRARSIAADERMQATMQRLPSHGEELSALPRTPEPDLRQGWKPLERRGSSRSPGSGLASPPRGSAAPADEFSLGRRRSRSAADASPLHPAPMKPWLPGQEASSAFRRVPERDDEVKRLSLELVDRHAEVAALRAAHRDVDETTKAMHVCLEALSTVLPQGARAAPADPAHPYLRSDETPEGGRQRLCRVVEAAAQQIARARRELIRAVDRPHEKLGVDALAAAAAGSLDACRAGLLELLDAFDGLADGGDAAETLPLPALLRRLARHVSDLREAAAGREEAHERAGAKLHALQQECLHLACELNEERATSKAAARLRAEIAAQNDAAATRNAALQTRLASRSRHLAGALARHAGAVLLRRYFAAWRRGRSPGAAPDSSSALEQQLVAALGREEALGEAALAAELRLRAAEDAAEAHLAELEATRERLFEVEAQEAAAAFALPTGNAADAEALSARLAAVEAERDTLRVEATTAQHRAAELEIMLGDQAVAAARRSQEMEARLASHAADPPPRKLADTRAAAALCLHRRAAHALRSAYYRTWLAATARASSCTAARAASVLARTARRVLLLRYWRMWWGWWGEGASAVEAADAAATADAAAAQIVSVQRCVASFQGRLLEMLSRHVCRSLLARYFAAWQHLATHSPEPRSVRLAITPTPQPPPSTSLSPSTHSGSAHSPLGPIQRPVVPPAAHHSPQSTRSGERRCF
eukprot:TRINITY_DN29923_c0_g1_i1.p1 TRINITY_DN29923_c0_g1~~TRINITY_DN29923_c0_g1_i1.p1  ORF type:complete len:816 (+),score=198.93 TRINITY_DN29923_c0_g1_i1:102-2549(+)